MPDSNLEFHGLGCLPTRFGLKIYQNGVKIVFILVYCDLEGFCEL